MPKSKPKASSPTPVKQREIGEFATIRRRMSSLLYDALLLLGVLFVIFLLPLIMIGMLWGTLPPTWIQRAYFVTALGIYFIGYWHHFGQTLAMQTWKLKLTNKEGKPVSWQQATLRYILAWFSLSFFGLGFFWALIDSERQFLHDRLTGCRILFIRRSQQNT